MKWKPHPNNPIIDGDILFGPGYRTEDSKVARAGNTYYVVTASGKSGPVMDIYLLKSPSLAGPWTKVQDKPIVSRGKFYEFDYRYLRVSGITFFEGTWYLYYSGQNIFRRDAVGVATASESDFPFGWKKYNRNPIFRKGQNEWESLDVVTLSLKRVGPKGREWYGHYTARGKDRKYHLGVCYGNSPYGPFVRNEKNPVLGPGKAWDSGGPARADFIEVNGKIYGAYESRGGSETPFYVGEYSGDLNGPFKNDPDNPTLSEWQYANPCLWQENGRTYMLAGRKVKEDRTPYWRHIDLFVKQ